MDDKTARDPARRPVLGLPKELLDHVNEYPRGLQDLKNVWLTGKNELAWSADEVMLKRLNPLYIECTRSSIDHIRTLIAHPLRLRYVTHVVQIVTLRADLMHEWVTNWYMSKAVAKCKPSDDLFQHIRDVHEAQRQEQVAFISTGEVSATLTELISKLPRLRRIAFHDRPPVPVCPPDCACMNGREITSHAYNRPRLWREQWAAARTNAVITNEHIQQYLLAVALYVADPRKYISPAFMFRALHTRMLATSGSLSSVALEFKLQNDKLLNEAWDEFSGSDGRQIATVMTRVSGVEISLEPSQANRAAPERTTHWRRLLNNTQCTTSVVLEGHGGQHIALLKTLVNTLTFPRLRNLKVVSQVTWRYHAERTRYNPPDHYLTSELIAFLLRHKDTVLGVELVKAAGVANHDSNQPSAMDFKHLLGTLKDGLPLLRDVRVSEEGDIQYGLRDENPTPSADEPANRSERSDLGVLAKSFKVEPTYTKETCTFGYEFVEYIRPGQSDQQESVQ